MVTNAKFAQQFRQWAESRPGLLVVDDGTRNEEDRLGAIGDIGFVLERVGIDDDLVVVAGDNLFDCDLSGFGRFAREVDEPVLAEKPAAARSTLMGVALYFYPRRTLGLVGEYLAAGMNPDQPGRLVEWLYPRVGVYTWRLPGGWYDIGSHESLAEADAAFAAQLP